MRRFELGPALALLGLITIAGAGEWFSIREAQRPIPRVDTEYQRVRDDTRANHQAASDHQPPRDPQSGGTRIYVENTEVFGVKRGEWLLFLATLGLWFATWQLVRGADKTAERQLRAYIGIFAMEVTVCPFEGGGFAYIAHAELRNFGQTPAYDIDVRANTVLAPAAASPFETDVPSPVQRSGKAIAFRDAGMHINASRNISAEDAEAIKLRTKRVYLWGAVTYKDVFKREHFFKFHLISDHQVTGHSGVYVLGPHPLGYEADY
ncbi:hypothetical protein [Pseudolabrys sp. FHR47]|uniref:hypothetical protein n=1 Tax=Pseudolabrys sp. FHR47 TaxID=2562284 RepID=UPI0010BF5F9B|nr:hypothetical protein [Pseudolabrys sp. FHR47]